MRGYKGTRGEGKGKDRNGRKGLRGIGEDEGKGKGKNRSGRRRGLRGG